VRCGGGGGKCRTQCYCWDYCHASSSWRWCRERCFQKFPPHEGEYSGIESPGSDCHHQQHRPLPSLPSPLQPYYCTTAITIVTGLGDWKGWGNVCALAKPLRSLTHSPFIPSEHFPHYPPLPPTLSSATISTRPSTHPALPTQASWRLTSLVSSSTAHITLLLPTVVICLRYCRKSPVRKLFAAWRGQGKGEEGRGNGEAMEG